MKVEVYAHILEEGQETDQNGQETTQKGQEKIIALIKDNPYISVSTLAEECEISIKTVRNIIDELRTRGVIERIGPDKGGYWKVLVEPDN